MEDFGLLVGRHFTALPTLVDTQLSELQLDNKGRLIVHGRWLAGTDSYAAADAGLSALAVRHDAGGPLAGIDNGEYTPLQVDDQGRLRVNAAVTIDSGAEKNEDDPHSSGDQGNYVLAVRSDVRPTNANTSADGDYASIFVNANGEVYVHDTDVLAQLVLIDAVLDNIKIDTGNIDTSLNNIEADIDSLVHLEDSQHVSGDAGTMPLAVRNDTEGSLVDANGDYAPLQVDADGRLRVNAAFSPPGSEQYSVTDALAAAGDGLETITAAATPWVTVASLAHTSGTAYVYGWQWACDQNAQARIVTDDTTNTVVYKTAINSSSDPSYQEHFADAGRIEIPGAANLEIRIQIKKRSVPGGNANGTGSMHIRTVA